MKSNYGPWYATYVDNEKATFVRVSGPVKARTVINYNSKLTIWLTLQDSQGEWVYALPVEIAQPVLKADNEWIPWEGWGDKTQTPLYAVG